VEIHKKILTIFIIAKLKILLKFKKIKKGISLKIQAKYPLLIDLNRVI